MTLIMQIYFDGAAKGNPGPSGAGWVIALNNQILIKNKKFLGKKTNNQAEYHALILALEDALKVKSSRNAPIKIILKGDSELLIKQLKGEYQVRNKTLKILHQKAKNLLSLFENWECKWIPREKNSIADSLANEAIIKELEKERKTS